MIHETLGGDKCPSIFTTLRRKLSRVRWRIRWLVKQRTRLKLIVGRLRRKDSHRRQPQVGSVSQRPIRLATFNVAMFSLAPAVPKPTNHRPAVGDQRMMFPKSILKQSPSTRSNRKVSINLPDNEISLATKFLSLVEDEEQKGGTSPVLFTRSKVPARSPICMMGRSCNGGEEDGWFGKKKSVFEVLSEVNADILGLQDVKAEEEKGMSPLSDLACALGMHYVFAESWAPQYGNAVLSRWPIKRWRVQKVADNDDFRNVLKTTIEVPWAGDLQFDCTQLDHLDEYWRLLQIRAIVESLDPPHILAGGLNSLEPSDYSTERWMDIVKYYEDIGKPKPNLQVMKFLHGKQYVDAKNYAADCEPVVIIAKGQNVQGTCKYGTRVDYVVASPYSPFVFVPGSYSVVSSKGTSDHHIVKVEVVRVDGKKGGDRRPRQRRHKAWRKRWPCSSTLSFRTLKAVM